MRWAHVVACLVTVTSLLTGCGDVPGRFDRGSSTPVAAPAISTDEVVAKARPSVVKVRGEAESCSRVLEGSGFVVAPNKVMTNAHVIAGAETFSVEVGGKTYDAQVVSYDPNTDVSILDVPTLSAQPLVFAGYTATNGTDALVLGYPGAESFKGTAVQIREVTELNGPDIYSAGSVTREVYILTGTFPRSGSSGSPLIDMDGRVLGVYFGAETHDSTTGFALTAAQVAAHGAGVGESPAVDTGACIG